MKRLNQCKHDIITMIKNSYRDQHMRLNYVADCDEEYSPDEIKELIKNCSDSVNDIDEFIDQNFKDYCLKKDLRNYLNI